MGAHRHWPVGFSYGFRWITALSPKKEPTLLHKISTKSLHSQGLLVTFSQSTRSIGMTWNLNLKNKKIHQNPKHELILLELTDTNKFSNVNELVSADLFDRIARPWAPSLLGIWMPLAPNPSPVKSHEIPHEIPYETPWNHH